MSVNTVAIAFKARNKDNRYLCDGIECGDWEDEFLDTMVLSDATLIIRNDLSKLDKKDIEDFYQFIAALPMSNDVQFIKDNYDPVEVELTPDQLRIVRERNDW
ncbi:hypothetical protein M5X06_31980 [Paenibacillus alvei]|uniref:Phage protein n=1 Tax=Paenibacillus alvei TaxID=44250 RepID=A0ABT4H6T0_PAEAL|nr:hypothetical protein [Paenibacillus alvei]MCY9764688.1 hypothetical protein [Paenibacillus alvei]MCY9771396.1 hypothetical protein [Paenibacillus alvei]